MRSFPDEFQQKMIRQLGEESRAFFSALQEKSPTSVRLNPDKPSNRFVDEERVPWCQEGRYLTERPEFVTDPLIFAGAYYVQEASSMFIAHILKTLVSHRSLKVLDMCAAPGGKSTLISTWLSDDGVLVANELVGKRVPSLIENVIRWGSKNVVITHNPIRDFSPLQNFFDVILLDAPCSGEGMFRKDEKAIQQWSESMVRSCALTQRQLIEKTAELLSPNGILIFSTCTFAEEEDEQNILKLLSLPFLSPMRVPILPDWKIVEVSVSLDEKIGYGYKFYPHRLKGEGFFVTVFQKDNKASKPNIIKAKLEMLPNKHLSLVNEYVETERLSFFLLKDRLLGISKAQVETFKQLYQILQIVYSGVEIGTFKNQKLIPSHALALSQAIRSELPHIELSRHDALLYLQRKDFNFPFSMQAFKDWVLVRHENLNLGWIKVLSNRINNYYPIEMRIKKDL